MGLAKLKSRPGDRERDLERDLGGSGDRADRREERVRDRERDRDNLDFLDRERDFDRDFDLDFDLDRLLVEEDDRLPLSWRGERPISSLVGAPGMFFSSVRGRTCKCQSWGLGFFKTKRGLKCFLGFRRC